MTSTMEGIPTYRVNQIPDQRNQPIAGQQNFSRENAIKVMNKVAVMEATALAIIALANSYGVDAKTALDCGRAFSFMPLAMMSKDHELSIDYISLAITLGILETTPYDIQTYGLMAYGAFTAYRLGYKWSHGIL